MQVDEEGQLQMLLDDIIDHGQDANAIGNEHAFAKTPNGMKRIKMTTADLQLCIQWRDVSTDWVALKDIKQWNLVYSADYVERMKIDDEPEFTWWVTYVQKKREIILSKVKSKYW